MILKTLEQGQHKATLVENGEDVLDALEKHDFDLVILDMHMPVISGVDVAKIFRFTCPDKKHIPILMLTANATPAAIQDCKDAGLDAYLTKPVAPQKLLNTISLLIENRPAAGLYPDLPLNVVNVNDPQHVPLLDLETLDAIARVAKDHDFMVNLVEEYIFNSQKRVTQIHTAITHKQYNDMSDLAHTLDGSSRSIGAKRLSLTADIIFKEVKTGHRSSTPRHLQELRTVFEQTRDALRSWLTSQKIIRFKKHT